MSHLGIAMLWAALATTGGSGLEDKILFKHQTIMVQESLESRREFGELRYHRLMRSGIHRGLNYLKPAQGEEVGKPNRDFNRLATAYHHPRGPAGIVMNKFNWFPDPRQTNTYHADARLPAQLVGHGAGTLMIPCSLPLTLLTGPWSEPPYAVVGLEIGTMASYARPLQTVHFYEYHPTIIELSLPKEGQPFFSFIHSARDRGAGIKAFQGEERSLLETKAPRNFYHAMFVELCPRDRLENISVDLVTKEGLKVCMDTLVEEGLLCFHTSNRYVISYPVIAAGARDQGWAVLVGKDANYNSPDLGHFSSEWVVVARKPEYLRHLKEPPGYQKVSREEFWQVPKPQQKYVWTDSGPNTIVGLLRDEPNWSRFKDGLQPLIEKVSQWLGNRPGDSYRFTYDIFEPLDQFFLAWRERANPTSDWLKK